ncbi:unnamed protein product, partial [marine sediment metagenome]
EQREKKKHDASVQNAYNHALYDMLFLVMTYLVRENGYQFRHRMFFNQRIIQGDALVFAKTGKKGIRLAGSPGTVDDENSRDGETHRLRITQYAIFERSFFERFELVKYRHDPCGRNEQNEEYKKCRYYPAVQPGKSSRMFEENQHTEQKRPSNNRRKR